MQPRRAVYRGEMKRGYARSGNVQSHAGIYWSMNRIMPNEARKFEVGITLLIQASSAAEARARLEVLLPASSIVQSRDVQYCEEHIAIHPVTVK